MYRIALILGLLVTPAVAAEKYDWYDCNFIEAMTNNCANKETECDPIIHYGGGMSRAAAQLADKHPSWDYDKFQVLCQQVCNGKITPQVALRKFCPWWRPEMINHPPK